MHFLSLNKNLFYFYSSFKSRYLHRSNKRCVNTSNSITFSHNLNNAEILFASVPATQHDMLNHPECAIRVPAIVSSIEKSGILGNAFNNRVVQLHDFKSATSDDILRVHQQNYVYGLEKASKDIDNHPIFIEATGPTYATSVTYESALKASGAAISLLDIIVKNDNIRGGYPPPVGFGLCRPPGHHAVPSGPMGFCIFGTVSITARYAQEVLNLKKVLIFDFDVHHGNGTQDAFYDDPSVLFISTHRKGSYPGTGKIDEIGKDRGEGYNINIPLPGGSGDIGIKSSFEEIVCPTAEKFKPDLILVSAGYDAHWKDPLETMQMVTSSYHYLGKELKNLANKLCNGKIIFMLEGGYDPVALGDSAVDTFLGILGEGSRDHFDMNLLTDEPVDKIKNVLREVRSIHSI